MQYLNSSSADVNGRAYQLGQWIRENWSEISGFVSDPTNLIFFALILLLAMLALGVTIRSVVKILRGGWNVLFPHAGEITLGCRREKPLDFILDPPVKLRFEDRRKGGVQIVGPTGQGKTTMMKHMILADAA